MSTFKITDIDKAGDLAKEAKYSPKLDIADIEIGSDCAVLMAKIPDPKSKQIHIRTFRLSGSDKSSLVIEDCSRLVERSPYSVENRDWMIEKEELASQMDGFSFYDSCKEEIGAMIKKYALSSSRYLRDMNPEIDHRSEVTALIGPDPKHRDGELFVKVNPQTILGVALDNYAYDQTLFRNLRHAFVYTFAFVLLHEIQHTDRAHLGSNSRVATDSWNKSDEGRFLINQAIDLIINFDCSKILKAETGHVPFMPIGLCSTQMDWSGFAREGLFNSDDIKDFFSSDDTKDFFSREFRVSEFHFPEPRLFDFDSQVRSKFVLNIGRPFAATFKNDSYYFLDFVKSLKTWSASAQPIVPRQVFASRGLFE